MKLPIERQLTLEGLRREAAQMHLDELIASHDFLLCHHMQIEYMLQQAMRRVAELELHQAMDVNSYPPSLGLRSLE